MKTRQRSWIPGRLPMALGAFPESNEHVKLMSTQHLFAESCDRINLYTAFLVEALDQWRTEKCGKLPDLLSAEVDAMEEEHGKYLRDLSKPTELKATSFKARFESRVLKTNEHPFNLMLRLKFLSHKLRDKVCATRCYRFYMECARYFCKEVRCEESQHYYSAWSMLRLVFENTLIDVLVCDRDATLVNCAIDNAWLKPDKALSVIWTHKRLDLSNALPTDLLASALRTFVIEATPHGREEKLMKWIEPLTSFSETTDKKQRHDRHAHIHTDPALNIHVSPRLVTQSWLGYLLDLSAHETTEQQLHGETETTQTRAFKLLATSELYPEDQFDVCYKLDPELALSHSWPSNIQSFANLQKQRLHEHGVGDDLDKLHAYYAQRPPFVMDNAQKMVRSWPEFAPHTYDKDDADACEFVMVTDVVHAEK